MRIGPLNKRVILQSLVAGTDTFGQPTSSWSNVTTTWAAISPLMGQEAIVGKQIQAEATHKVIIRYRSGVTTKQRLVFESRNLNIVDVLDPQEEHVQLNLLCKEEKQ